MKQKTLSRWMLPIVITLLLSGCRTVPPAQESRQTATPAPTATTTPVPTESASPAPADTATPAPTAAPVPTASSTPASTPDKASSASGLKIDHLVIVVEENHSYEQVVGSSNAPFIQSLIAKGALFTDAHGVTHPSQPNYLAFFSGSTQGVTNDSCHKPFSAPNLASELSKNNLTFAGYSEDLPKTGFSGCWSGQYARKHNPWTQFKNVPAAANRPLTDFPEDYSKLPTVSFVIPNEKHDMHSGSIGQADAWLKDKLGGYAAWAQTHNSALMISWDEDDFSKKNHIPIIIAGPMIKQGKYAERVDHYSMLRWIEEVYGLAKLGASEQAAAIRVIK